MWIRIVKPGEADGLLKLVYDEILSKRGRISNILISHSLRPAAVKAHFDLYLDLMFGQGKLSRQEREMIAVAVSSQNDCQYCVSHHGAALNFHRRDEEFVKALAKKQMPPSVSPRELAIIGFARKLTSYPEGMAEADLERLRTAGLSDEEILDVVLIAAYFNFVNRIASALGVPVEAWFQASHVGAKTWT